MKKYILLSFFTALIMFANVTNARIIEVGVYNNYFAKTSSSVMVGDTIRWTLVEGSHTTTSTSVPQGAATWNYTFAGPNDTYIYVVTVPGVYEYECTFHAGMRGSFSTGVPLPFAEDFNFPVGDSLTYHGWVTHSGSAFNMAATAPGLTFTGYPGSNVGNATTLTGSGADYHRLFDTTASPVIYAAFMAKITTPAAGYFFHLSQNPHSTFNFRGRVWVNGTAQALQIGLAYTNEAAVYSTNTYSGDSTYLFVLKYQVVPGDFNDSVALFIFRPGDILPATEPAMPTVGPIGNATTTQTDIFPGSVNIRQFNNAHNITIDGIRVFTQWDSFIPVELSSFTAVTTPAGVELKWNTASEINNSGFEIERKAEGSSWTKIGFVQGAGTTTEKNAYSFVDNTVNTGAYSYRLKQIDFDGTFEYSGVVSVNFDTPATYSLSQNYPNPFNPSTKINFSIPVASNVKISVFNSLGQEVAVLADGMKDAGSHSVIFEAGNLPAGIYMYSIEAGDYKEVRKMTLLK
ncbi:MAG: T9SS type A sorting domain-containing protein [Ignavibacteriaceae bacterium]|nr:T9SS type A sorting domain-containing protein [Ignavibacteriaceae bacterium]